MKILKGRIRDVQELLRLRRVLHVDALVVQPLSDIVQLRDAPWVIARTINLLPGGHLLVELRDSTAHGLRRLRQGVHSSVPG